MKSKKEGATKINKERTMKSNNQGIMKKSKNQKITQRSKNQGTMK